MKAALNWFLLILRNPKTIGFVLSVFVFFLIVFLKSIGALQIVELAIYDQNIILKNDSPGKTPPILLLIVKEEDIQRFGQWPISDKVLSDIIEKVSKHKPTAIGLDIYRDIPVPPGHKQLQQTFLNHSNIIAIEKFGGQQSTGIPGPSVLRNTEQLGFNDIPSDSGGIVRRGLLFLDDGQNYFFSFPLRLSLLYLQSKEIYPQPGEPDPYHLRLGDTTLLPFEYNFGSYIHADAAGYQFMLDFKGGLMPFDMLSLKDLFDKTFDPALIKDRVVIIGVDAESVKDHFFTPFSSDLKEDSGISGPALHAHIVNQLIRTGVDGDKPIMTFTDEQELLWVMLWCLIGAIVGIWIRSALYFSVISFIGLFILTGVNYYGFSIGYWVPLVPAVIGWLSTVSVTTAYISYFEKLQKNQLMQIFSKYVSSEVADTIWQSKDLLLEDGRLAPKKLVASVFFTDLQGFTAVSEQWEPEVLMDWLNDYMEQMAMVVIEHHGVVDDYFGDAIKANFGVPIPKEDYYDIREDVINAIDCALEMSRKMDVLNIQWQNKGLPSMRMRIGINTGEVVAGSLGSSERMKYTTVGDTVNTAARLESLKREAFITDNSYGACRIFVSEATLNYVKNVYKSTLVDTISLKGKQEKITVHWIESRNKVVNDE